MAVTVQRTATCASDPPAMPLPGQTGATGPTDDALRGYGGAREGPAMASGAQAKLGDRPAMPGRGLR